MRTAVIALGCLLGVTSLGGCSRSPSEAAGEATQAAAKAALEPIIVKDASRQAAKLVAQLDPREECNRFRADLTETGKGSAVSGKTQAALIETMKSARAAGCVTAR